MVSFLELNKKTQTGFLAVVAVSDFRFRSNLTAEFLSRHFLT